MSSGRLHSGSIAVGSLKTSNQCRTWPTDDLLPANPFIAVALAPAPEPVLKYHRLRSVKIRPHVCGLRAAIDGPYAAFIPDSALTTDS